MEESSNQPIKYFYDNQYINLVSPIGLLLPLRFEVCAKASFKQGLTRCFSETSVLSKIVPGLYTSIFLANIEQPRKIFLKEEEYEVESGWISLEVSKGKMLQTPFGIRWVYQSFICTGGEVDTGTLVAAEPLMERLKRYKLAETLVNGGVYIKLKDGKVSIMTLDKAHIPVFWQEENIMINEKAFIRDETLENKLIQATAVPFDEHGRYLIRAKGILNLGAQSGFGLLEVHCNLKEKITLYGIEPDVCLPLQMEQKRNKLCFLYKDKMVLEINNEGSKYIKVFRKERFPFLRRGHLFLERILQHG